MPIVVDISVRKNFEKICAESNNISLDHHDKVIVQTENGLEYGVVLNKEHLVEKLSARPGKVVRKCNEKDVLNLDRNRAKESKAFIICVDIIKKRGLKMKLTTIEYTFDRQKLFIYYTAEGRVDFRELLKDLGYTFKTKIQMVQVGVRDEAKIVGGCGHCGKELCCRSFLRDFKPVVVEMVKSQDLSLNPTKISGLCGRLMCCLGYEYSFYKDACKNMPNVGDKMRIENKDVVVKNRDILKGKVEVVFEDGSAKVFDVSELRK